MNKTETNKIEYRMDKIDNKVDKVDNRVDKVDNRVDKVDNRMDKFTNDQQNTRKILSAAMEKHKTEIEARFVTIVWRIIAFGGGVIIAFVVTFFTR